MFKKKGFVPLVIVSFTNAFIDLGHKIVIQNTIFKLFDGPAQIGLMAIVNALILLPFILFFTPSGYISDKYPKDKVLRVSMIICIMATIGVTLTYHQGWFWGAFGLTFILAVQSAFFSPAKLGYIREIVGKQHLAQANAMIQSIVIISILMGIFCYSIGFEALIPTPLVSLNHVIGNMVPMGYLLIGIAILQYIIALALPTVRKTVQTQLFNVKHYLEAGYLKANLKEIYQNETIWLSIIALTVFWAINQTILVTFGAHLKEVCGITNTVIAQGILALGGFGIVGGAFYAGRISKNFVELGLIPLAAFLIMITLGILPLLTSPILLTITFIVYGISGGLFLVPLESLIQFNANKDQLGKMQAGKNFIQNCGMILCLLVTVITTTIGLTSYFTLTILFVMGVMGSAYAFYKLPQSFLHLIMRYMLSQKYHLNVVGLNQFPSDKGALLLGNHSSWLDWVVLQMALPRRVHFVMTREQNKKWYLKFFMNFSGTFSIPDSHSQSNKDRIKKLLEAGATVIIFPEKYISRTGQLGKFDPETINLNLSENIQIIPFYIHGLWGTRFSLANKQYKQQFQHQSVNEITVHLGAPLLNQTHIMDIKQAISQLSMQAWQQTVEKQPSIAQSILKISKRDQKKIAIIDSSNKKITYLQLLIAAKLLKSTLKKQGLFNERVGLLLPTSAAGVITNVAIIFAGKEMINLNFTLGEETLLKCIKKAKISTIITAKKFIKKLEKKEITFSLINKQVKWIYLEDIFPRSTSKKLFSWLQIKVLPNLLLKKLIIEKNNHDVACILFSSGSEGSPKGIQLTQQNIRSNIDQIATIFSPNPNDRIINNLPLFHAFGLTVGTLMPLIKGLPIICVPDPTDTVLVGKLTARNQGTILCGTNTFLRLYAKQPKLYPLMFKTVRMVVAGAEKVTDDLRTMFKEKFGLEIHEGYGTTETAPVASMNIPDQLIIDDWHIQKGHKKGTVGQALPGTVFQIVDPQTHEPCNRGEEGLILIGGPQVMKGYLDEPAKTKKAIIQASDTRWYNTGDKGKLDEDGFLTIVDRYSRFAKIGGEMVSLGAIEKTLFEYKTEPELDLVAITIPDLKKGENIIVLVSGIKALDTFKEKIKKAPLQGVQKPNHYLLIKEIPKLGSGKTDYVMAKKIAVEELNKRK